ncbi:MAG: hypothetical protein AAGC55_13675, partial [Myxococcota bacterium]
RSGAVLAISRVNYPNLAAWRSKTMPDYSREVENGLRAAVRDYRRIDQREHRLGRVPALDLAFRHGGERASDERGEWVVLMRFLFFRRYSLSLTLTMPADRYRRFRRAHRAVRDSFQPYFPSP